MRENEFQAGLIKQIKSTFPGCFVLKNDSSYIQGIPDLTILYKDHWAVLQCKKDRTASHQPNQDYYVDQLNKSSYSAFVYPQNKEEVISELKRLFKVC